MRTCSSCGQSKSLGNFYAAGPARKINYECKACHSARKKRRRLERQAAGFVAAESRCTGCGETKPSSEFRTNWGRSSGLDTWCHECVSHGNRKLHFDLTPEEYAAKLVDQDGVCAICRRAEVGRAKNGRIKALAVDHDHNTGVVRGLLCANCNKGIGNLGEDVDRLLAAARYLLEYSDEMRTTQSAEGSMSPPNEEVV